MSSVRLSAGSLAVMLTESSSIPTKMKHVVGPTHLSDDSGMPISVTAWSIAFKREAQYPIMGVLR